MIVPTKYQLLNRLPLFNNSNEILKDKQQVHDIIKEVCEAQRFFASDYDNIYQFFDYGSIYQICKRLWIFCKENIYYEIESEDYQTTRSPSAILSLSDGDCKHYSGFIAGVLAAINRNTDKKINWFYRFAGYSYTSNEVAHVFVVVNDNGNEIWIDPVLSNFNQHSPKPVIFIDKKINDKMLSRLSGLENSYLAPVEYDNVLMQQQAVTDKVILSDANLQIPAGLDTAEDNISPELVAAIKQILYYGIIDQNLTWNDTRAVEVLGNLSDQDKSALNDAIFLVVTEMQKPIISGFFGQLWNDVKTISATPIRAAFLSLVSLNVFNLAKKIYDLVYNADGSFYTPGYDKVHTIWYKWGGQISNLLNAAKNGHNKKAILGAITTGTGTTATATAVTAASCAIPGVGPWICAALAIITAMLPVLSSALQQKAGDGQISSQDQQAALNAYNASFGGAGSLSSSSISKYLPFLIIGGAAAFIYFDGKKRKK